MENVIKKLKMQSTLHQTARFLRDCRHFLRSRCEEGAAQINEGRYVEGVEVMNLASVGPNKVLYLLQQCSLCMLCHYEALLV